MSSLHVCDLCARVLAPGGRRFLLCSFSQFWARYLRLDLRDRHFYEIIRESTPCHLYFDLEFARAFNPSAPDDVMVNTFIRHTAQYLQVCRG